MGKTGKRKRNRSSVEATVRQKREERNGRNRKPSSLERKQRRRKEPERKGQRPKVKAEGKHSWNGCGSETRKDERKHTAMPSTETGKECMGNQAGENGESRRNESENGAL